MVKMGLPMTAICLILVAIIGMSSASPHGNSDFCINRACTYEYDPVCGSNGVTYGNPCEFNLERRCRNPRLRLLCRRPCNECYHH